jgi:hypothetical protein
MACKGSWVGTFVVRDWRSWDERSRTRFEQWIDGTGDVHWRSRDETDVVTVCGLDRSGQGRSAIRSTVPGRSPGCRRRGTTRAATPSGSSTSLRRPRRGPRRQLRVAAVAGASFPLRYLKRVRYGNTQPLSADEAEPASNRWCFELVLDYGGHADPLAPGVTPDRAWPAQEDASRRAERGSRSAPTVGAGASSCSTTSLSLAPAAPSSGPPSWNTRSIPQGRRWWPSSTWAAGVDRAMAGEPGGSSPRCGSSTPSRRSLPPSNRRPGRRWPTCHRAW